MESSRSAQCRADVSSGEDDTALVGPSPSALDGDTASSVSSEPVASSELTADEKSEQYDSFDEVSAGFH